MVNKNQLLRRLLVLGCVLLLCFGLAGGQLVQLQLVDGESYLRRSAEFLTTTSTVSAARGEILDRYGRPLVTNQTGFSLVLIYASFWEDNDSRFETLLDLANRVRADSGMTAAEGDTADSGEEDADTGSGTDAEGTAASDGGAVLNVIVEHPLYGEICVELNVASRYDAQAFVERMGLDADAHHLPSQASGGQQQRCAVARSVVNDPDIVFADEPTGALNRANTLEVLSLLCELNGSGQSICMVTHDVLCALRANRVLYLEDGSIKGELELPAFRGDGGGAYLKARDAQVNAWLSSLAW